MTPGDRPRREERSIGSERPARHGPGGDRIAPIAALIVGIAYLAIGIIGFAATGFTGFVSEGKDELLGFDLNIFHNIVHIAIGGGLIVFSRLSDPTIVQGVLIGGGLVYLLAAALGFLNQLQILSIDSPLALDNFLHLASGSLALLVGLLGARQQSKAAAAYA